MRCELVADQTGSGGPAPGADRDVDRLEVGALPEQLDVDGGVAGDDRRGISGIDIRHTALVGELTRVGDGLGHRRAEGDDGGPEQPDRVHLGGRRAGRDDDRRGGVGQAGGIRDGLGVVAGRGGDQ